MKVMNLPIPVKKGSASWSAKPQTAKKGDDSSESSPPPSACTHSSRRPIASKSRPTAPRSFVDSPPFCRTRGSERKSSLPPSSTTTKKRVCYL